MKPIFTTAYFPPIAYMAQIVQYDGETITIEKKETFPKQTIRNRMQILSANGVKTLSIPVIRNNHSRTEEIVIDYKERWNLIHWRTIESAYAASPFFQYYQDELETILMNKYTHLIEINEKALVWVLEKMKIKTNILYTDVFSPIIGTPTDYRQQYSSKHPNIDIKNFMAYYQVFSDRFDFQPNLSILDLLMNLGPQAKEYLFEIRKKDLFVSHETKR